MNVDQLYQFINFIANKESSGAHMGPDEFNELLPRAQDDFFIKRYGVPEDYQPGRPFPRQAFELTQKILDDLRPLKKPIENPPRS